MSRNISIWMILPAEGNVPGRLSREVLLAWAFGGRVQAIILHAYKHHIEKAKKTSAIAVIR